MLLPAAAFEVAKQCQAAPEMTMPVLALAGVLQVEGV
jgi:hypothetical protein